MDAGEMLAGITEAGLVVVAGELAAVEVNAVYPNAGEGVSSGLGLLREVEGPAEELEPPPLSTPDSESEPESPAAELVAVALDGNTSPALETTPVLSGLERGSRSFPSRPSDPVPDSVGYGPEAKVVNVYFPSSPSFLQSSGCCP